MGVNRRWFPNTVTGLGTEHHFRGVVNSSGFYLHQYRCRPRYACRYHVFYCLHHAFTYHLLLPTIVPPLNPMKLAHH